MILTGEERTARKVLMSVPQEEMTLRESGGTWAGSTRARRLAIFESTKEKDPSNSLEFRPLAPRFFVKRHGAGLEARPFS